jgi:hypothetical protein
MKNGWNDNWVTYLNASHVTKFICADISLQHEAKEMQINTNRVTNFWHNSSIHIAIQSKLLPYTETNKVTNFWHTHCNSS